MNKFKFYFILFSTLLVLFSSCNKDDDEVAATPLRDFDEQFKTDIEDIELYLKTHKLNPEITDYSEKVNNSSLFIKCDTTDIASLSKLTPTTYPKLLSKLVTINSHDMAKPYKVYYLVFNEGNSTEKPCPLDEVLVTYRGTSLKSETETQSTGQVEVINATEFENSSVSSLFTLSSVISGWQEIFPMFGKGFFDEVATGNGPNLYTNYGAGIMFLPSGLAYYNGSRTNIPSYSPLVFSFQLLNFKRIDNDSDGIFSVDEIVKNNDGIYDVDSYIDTDGDGTADYRDFDDDDDGFPTLNERKYTLPIDVDPFQISYYYPYNGALVNDPETLIDETKGIPNCSNDFTTPTRIRKHLDKNCH